MDKIPDKMTADELNRRLAEALGWRAGGCYDREFIIAPSGAWLGIGHAVCTDEFDPARRVDILRDYVLPEIERRGLFRAWVDAVLEATTDKQACSALEVAGVPGALLETEPLERAYAVAAILWGASCETLAEAALKALEEVA